MKTTKIEWTENTWNPVTGCTKISLGCEHCYAEVMSRRLKAMGKQKYANGFSVTLHEECLNEPLTWRKPQTNVRLYEIVLSNEFLPKHANEVLKEIQKENLKFHVNDINSGKPARKGAFYLSYSYYNSDPKVEIYIEQ